MSLCRNQSRKMGENMKLELTVSKEIVRKKFDISDKYNMCRERLNKHKLIVSNELIKTWEQDSKDNNYNAQFQNWYFSIINSKKKFKKVIVEHSSKIKNAKTYEEKVMIGTAMSSDDKILVGNVELDTRRKNKKVKFVSEGTFMKEKSQTVTMREVRKVIVGRKQHSIFDIYETPTRLEVPLDSESDILATYLSKFLMNSTRVIIKDRYINQKENERNLNQYILRYINKESCMITFVISGNGKNEEITKKFTNYNGYKSKVEFLDKKYTHHSYIETDEFIIDLGYRLRVFGDVDDGKTEQEVINITRK
ncbi:hypothetical protein Curi_c25390 [Gottschalkia acidurici 9a]|uniref:Uncharacterized protein n=1 Tax=Gottschalkia acidurici (strain ATCC 7906 / DSM 604 / BCRC 14475 / CIP 104303 / KCTC 5404 / NCIMB 10678 / 9a) TaxID=1128398 RepID=K0B232_GOTA9|nr:hypothetical protein [Gottschalkia acidurici]AFS79534.1 hypothetical protein Curi_c25390 [Gottschalkia acidurici 9a]